MLRGDGLIEIGKVALCFVRKLGPFFVLLNGRMLAKFLVNGIGQKRGHMQSLVTAFRSRIKVGHRKLLVLVQLLAGAVIKRALSGDNSVGDFLRLRSSSA